MQRANCHFQNHKEKTMNRFLCKCKFEFNATLKKSVTLSGRVRHLLACGLVVGQLVGATYAQGGLPVWGTDQVPECTEYLPKRDSKGLCHVTIKIPEIKPGTNPANAAPTHSDITLRPNVAAGVILRDASPLMSCTLGTTPAALTRDPSTSITTVISTLATLGLPGGGLALQPNLLDANVAPPPPPPLPTEEHAKKAAENIVAELKQLQDDSRKPADNYQQALADYQKARATVLKDWEYHYASDDDFSDAATEMYNDLSEALADPLPSADNFKDLNKSAEQIEKELESFTKTYKDDESQSWYKYAESQLTAAKTSFKSLMSTIMPQVQFLNDLQALLKPAFTWLNAKSTPPGSGIFTPDPQNPWTTIYLPMSRFAQKQVTEAISCKDVASKDPAFNTVTFTAYYEPAASWDFSAAAFLSLLPGRQLGTYTQSQPAGTTTAGPSILAATTQSSHQFIPGAVFELHPGPMNFRCPWAADWPSRAREGTGYHPWGYVCSIGPAVGFLVNANSGTTQAEFFEGISFGIHRLAILVGNHTGRFEEFADGYALGQSAPAGTMPATTRRWTNHPAIGISYRIPIR
jgi:hypothetical protein